MPVHSWTGSRLNEAIHALKQHELLDLTRDQEDLLTFFRAWVEQALVDEASAESPHSSDMVSAMIQGIDHRTAEAVLIRLQKPFKRRSRDEIPEELMRITDGPEDLCQTVRSIVFRGWEVFQVKGQEAKTLSS